MQVFRLLPVVCSKLSDVAIIPNLPVAYPEAWKGIQSRFATWLVQATRADYALCDLSQCPGVTWNTARRHGWVHILVQ
jgi:hypothetical protein